MARLIDADALKERWTIASPEPYNTDAVEVLDSIDEAPTVDAIPIAVIKMAIEGINFADQADQAGRWSYELRSALRTVLKWYETPSYKEREKRTQKLAYRR